MSAERILMIMPPEPVTPGGSDDFDFLAAWRMLWDGRWLIVAITLAVAGLSAAYAFSARSWYSAEVLLAPVTAKSGQGLSGQLGQFGGLAALAGINLGGSSSTAEPLAVLKSRDFAGAFIDDQKLLTVLFADKWDQASRSWKSADPKNQPDIRDAVKFFDQRVRNVQEDKKTGLVKLTIEWTDADVAANWANLLADRLNDHMRERALREAETNVSFLQEEFAETNVVTLQQSIGRLLESELEKVMMARGNKEFAYRVIDRAVTPKWRAKPRRVEIVALGVIGGGLLGMLFVIVRYVTRRVREQRPDPAQPTPADE